MMSNDGNRKPAFDRLPVHPVSVPDRPITRLAVDDLAQLIRIYDGKNDLGAGALAERLLPHVEGSFAALAESHAELLQELEILCNCIEGCGLGELPPELEGQVSFSRQTIARAERVGGE